MANQTNPYARINNQKLKAARQEMRIDVEQLAHAVCLSKKNILEIENSEGFDSFYSYPIKVTAAKRVGRYLGLNESDFLELDN